MAYSVSDSVQDLAVEVATRAQPGWVPQAGKGAANLAAGAAAAERAQNLVPGTAYQQTDFQQFGGPSKGKASSSDAAIGLGVLAILAGGGLWYATRRRR